MGRPDGPVMSWRRVLKELRVPPLVSNRDAQEIVQRSRRFRRPLPQRSTSAPAMSSVAGLRSRPPSTAVIEAQIAQRARKQRLAAWQAPPCDLDRPDSLQSLRSLRSAPDLDRLRRLRGLRRGPDLDRPHSLCTPRSSRAFAARHRAARPAFSRRDHKAVALRIRQREQAAAARATADERVAQAELRVQLAELRAGALEKESVAVLSEQQRRCTELEWRCEAVTVAALDLMAEQAAEHEAEQEALLDVIAELGATRAARHRQ